MWRFDQGNARRAGAQRSREPFGARGQNGAKGRLEVADEGVGVPGRMDYWEEPGPHTDSSKVSSEGSWILSSARTNG